jgi:RNA polymerase-binding transcription factor DksA
MSSRTTLRAQLEARLAVIGQRVERIEGDLRRTPDRDWVEQATELENDEVLEGLDDLGRTEAREIRETLRRIEGGTYGFCLECQQPIDEARLRAVPTAGLCIYCAK